MKYVITSKQTAKNYLLNTENELEAILANHVQGSGNDSFTIRAYKPDIDTDAIFRIYLKIIEVDPADV